MPSSDDSLKMDRRNKKVHFENDESPEDYSDVKFYFRTYKSMALKSYYRNLLVKKLNIPVKRKIWKSDTARKVNKNSKRLIPFHNSEVSNPYLK